MAKEILEEVGYPLGQIDEMLEIISEHDTRPGFISTNEGLVRDADNLWRFSSVGFAADVRGFGNSRVAQAGRLATELERPDFFIPSPPGGWRGKNWNRGGREGKPGCHFYGSSAIIKTHGPL